MTKMTIEHEGNNSRLFMSSVVEELCIYEGLTSFQARIERGELRKCIRNDRIHIGFAKSKEYQCFFVFFLGAYRHIHDMHSHQRPFLACHPKVHSK